MRSFRRTRVLQAAFILAFAVLAGCATALPDDGPAPTISEAAARSVVERVQAAALASGSGESFTVTATEEELTSLVAIGAEVLAYYQSAHASGVTPVPRQIPGIDALLTDEQWQEAMDGLFGNPAGPGALLLELRSRIEEPLIYLKADGTLVLRGRASAAGASLPLRVVLRPERTGDRYTVRLVQAQLGTARAPDQVTELIEEAIAQGLDAAYQSVRITGVEITEGQITVSGTVQ